MNTENRRPIQPKRVVKRSGSGLSDRPARGYLIAHLNAADLQRYALHHDVNQDAFTRFGGRFIVRAGEQHTLVGDLKTQTIVVEFESLQVAMDCCNALEKQGAMSLSLSLASADAILVEGFSDR